MSELLFTSLASVFLLLFEPCRNSFLSKLLSSPSPPYALSSCSSVRPSDRCSSTVSCRALMGEKVKEEEETMRCLKKTLSVGEPSFFSLFVLRPGMVLFSTCNTKYNDEKKCPPFFTSPPARTAAERWYQKLAKKKGLEVRYI